MLYRASREFPDLFRTVNPMLHGSKVESIPRTAAVFDNNCVGMYVSPALQWPLLRHLDAVVWTILFTLLYPTSPSMLRSALSIILSFTSAGMSAAA